MLGCRSRRKAEAPHCPRAPSTRLCRHNKQGGVRHWYRTATTRVRVEKKQNWGPVRSSASTAITPSCGRQHAAYVCHVSQGARPSRSPLQCAGTAGGASAEWGSEAQQAATFIKQMLFPADTHTQLRPQRYQFVLTQSTVRLNSRPPKPTGALTLTRRRVHVEGGGVLPGDVKLGDEPCLLLLGQGQVGSLIHRGRVKVAPPSGCEGGVQQQKQRVMAASQHRESLSSSRGQASG